MAKYATLNESGRPVGFGVIARLLRWVAKHTVYALEVARIDVLIMGVVGVGCPSGARFRLGGSGYAR
jgi:hypothetical protein